MQHGASYPITAKSQVFNWPERTVRVEDGGQKEKNGGSYALRKIALSNAVRIALTALTSLAEGLAATET